MRVMVVSWVGLRVAMVPIIRHTNEPIIALIHNKTVTYSHFRWVCLAPSIGAAPHRMALLRRMNIGATGTAATELKPSTPDLQSVRLVDENCFKIRCEIILRFLNVEIMNSYLGKFCEPYPAVPGANPMSRV